MLVQFNLQFAKVVGLFYLESAKLFVVFIEQIYFHNYLLSREAVFQIFIVRIKNVDLIKIEKLLAKLVKTRFVQAFERKCNITI